MASGDTVALSLPTCTSVFHRREGKMWFGKCDLHAAGPQVAFEDGAMQGKQAAFSKG